MQGGPSLLSLTETALDLASAMSDQSLATQSRSGLHAPEENWTRNLSYQTQGTRRTWPA